MQQDIAGIRKTYSQKTLTEDSIDSNPIRQFDTWWQEAIDADIDEINAMTLATASVDGVPSARIVLLKGYSENGFIFFTNYDSYKGKQLLENPKACLVFFWKELERQIRITGLVEKVDENESDEYFHSRPVASQLGASISPQSAVIENREWLEKRYDEFEKKTGNNIIERPANWGGYLVKPVIIEFWQGRPSRLHDRIEYSLQENGEWKTARLAP
ncbi:pyridoxamine 5'-phosphate oxidase [Terrimonas pollutisoli]|uniref:pyridoxamine 5'-phosphate oxidase n=1 Tax=Terrimonas pollutisoli TaxID=3034147 RepID=UPI0023EABA81|nr:pyridoxamine 5'-phosphate oxidase [Terrimonas sp. H1YJ31]